MAISAAAALRAANRNFWFYRSGYGVTRIDADLVPWFPSLIDKRWISASTQRAGKEVRVDVAVLENVYSDNKQVVAYALRVGSFVTPSFSIAKLLQVPAKLRGENLFEIVVLTTPCLSDCTHAVDVTAEELGRIIAGNVH